MTTITATEARKQLYKLLDDVSDSHEPVQITGSAATPCWSARLTARSAGDSVPRVSRMRESIIKGMATPPEELDSELRW